jgi:hypothetical protein
VDDVVVGHTLDEPVETVSSRPPCRSLATVTADGHHRVSPPWYDYDYDCDPDAGTGASGVFRIVADARTSYTGRLRRESHVALAVVEVRPATGRVRHVGVRGRARVEPFDADRAARLFARYVCDGRDGRLRADGGASGRWRIVRVDPRSVVARDRSDAPPG